MIIDLIQLLEMISQIEEKVGDPSISGDLFSSAVFLKLYETPGQHLNAARELLLHPVLDQKRKIILTYSLQKLPPSDFLAVVSHAMNGVKEKKLSPKILETLAFPSFEWGGGLVDRSGEPEVRKIIESIAALDELSPLKKEYIRTKVVTGIAREDLLDYRELHSLE